jgi:hypothetical protein
VLLRGGLPRGVVTELVGAGSSGKTSLAYALTASVTTDSFAAWIDLPDAFDPEHAGAAGICLGHVLWIRPREPRTALRAAEQVADAGGFPLVLIDLDAPSAPPLRLPAGCWLRLARAAERGRSAVVILTAHRTAGTFASLALETERQRHAFSGHGGPCPLFESISGTVHVRKDKLGPPGMAKPFAAAAT